MIRSFTIVTFLMACGSGLYLYRSKHEVQVLDKKIEQTEREIGVLRDQSRSLVTKWTMMNDPDRLHAFSDMYLSLKPALPSQYSSLADLDSRLPPPRADVPSDASPDAPLNAPQDHASAVSEPDAVAIKDAPPAVADETLPIPPLPSVPPAAPAARLPERKVAAARPAVADAPPSRPAAVEQRLAEARSPRQPDRASDPRPVEPHPPAPPQPLHAVVPRPLPINPPPQAARPSQTAMASQPAMATGSLLGMARGAALLPSPRPVPVNGTNWYNAN